MQIKNQLPSLSGSTTKLTPSQIDLRAMFSVELILKSRGYQIKKKGVLAELLISTTKFADPDYEMLLQCFNDKNSRKEIHDYIRNDKNPSLEGALKLALHPNFVKKEQVFTKTFEWYIGEAMVRFFGGLSFSYGVEVLDVRLNQTKTDSGDFDTLVVMRNMSMMYFECKTGGFTSDKIQKAVDRAISLNCECVVIVAFSLNEEHLIETILKADHPLLGNSVELNKIQIMSNSESTIYEWHNCYFISASKDFIEQMKTVLRITEAKRNYYTNRYRPLSGDRRLFNKIGYLAERLSPPNKR